MDWQEQLISFYLFISKHYQSDLHQYCLRLSSHYDLGFSDSLITARQLILCQ